MFLFLAFSALDPTQALFNSLPQSSVEKQLAFYQLYQDHPLGEAALRQAAAALNTQDLELLEQVAPCFNPNAKGTLTLHQIHCIEKLALKLPNRQLRGYRASSLEEIYALEDDQVDLGVALIFSQHEDVEQARFLAREYSAKLDVMALHVLAALPENAGYMEKIRALNHFVFETMHFRFPPQSLYAKDIDTYTFLPSVMDNHLGVCLGVTALYFAVAQRIDLPLEVVTPPGHIFLRYNTGDDVINIETTARGIHVPTEHYLGMNTHTLPLRTVKEIVSMTHVNQASVFLQRREFTKAIKAYRQALPYCPEDHLIRELLGYALVLNGEGEEGKKYLKEVAFATPEHAVKRHVMAEDYLKGEVDAEGIYTVFQEVNEDRDSILNKIEKMDGILKKYPRFRDGLLQMAVSYLQFNRIKEALPYLERYHELDSNDPTVSYYLAVLYGECRDYNQCWEFLDRAQAIVQEKDFKPKALKELRLSLRQLCPQGQRSSA
jgi:regulator of sirC expression with transglutaminase-like and TPR domain